MSVKLHDPDRTLDYTFNWAPYLTSLGSGITISSVVFSITPQDAASPAQPALSGSANTPTTATINVGGVTKGNTHRLTCTMTPSAGQPDDQSQILRGGHE